MTTMKKKQPFTLEQQNSLRKVDREAQALEAGGLGVSTDEPENDLGKRVEFQRRAKALTQEQLAELTQKADQSGKGLSRSVISLYELGINRPGIKEVRLLCESLQVSPSYLIYGDEHPFEEKISFTHFDGIADSEPEFFARIVYCFKRLDPVYTFPIMQMVMRTLGDDIKGLMEWHADRVFLEIADDLKAILEEKQAKSKK
jgi:transcriptional regulator with XRE-family HTH domain